MTTVTGNTYPVRAQLKELGGRWDPTRQGWNFTSDQAAEEAREIVAAAGPAQPYTPRRNRSRRRYGRSKYRSTYTRFSSGAEVFTNKNGRCEDAPCCGCCS